MHARAPPPAPDVLQVAFFEALPERAESVERLIGEARAEARRRGLRRIVAGLNGHLAYGVGFLADAFDVPCPFDSLYTPPYYLPYWSTHADAVRTLSTYRFVVAQASLPDGVLRRGSERFHYRRMDTSRFREEMTLLGELSNRFLDETDLYFERDPYAMYQLLRPIRPLLRSEHLVFACRDGREIGFLFWHPDFNEVVPGGRRNSALATGIRCLGALGQLGTELQSTLAHLGEVDPYDIHNLNLETTGQVRQTIWSGHPDVLVNASAYTAVDQAESEPEKAIKINGEIPALFAEEAARLMPF